MAKKPCDCDSGKMTFEQWAASGGAIPLSFKGREKAWANQVRKYAAGGAVDNTVPDMSDGGQIIDGPSFQAGGAVKLFNLLKGTQEVLPAAQREANLQRMLAESKAPMRLYHGTMATEGGKNQEAIRRIKPSREGALGSGVYLTPQSEFASTYAGFPARSQLERDIKTGSDFAKKSARQLLDRMDRGAVEPHEVGGNMLPVYAQIKNPLVLEGKGDPMIEALVKLGMDKDAAGKMVESAYERKGYIGKEVESRARAAGYDGLMQYRDGNLSEVVSYNPNAIKSATGNVGTFDVTKPDLSKADGGEVNMQAGGVSKLTKSLTGAKKAEDAAKTSLGEVGSMVTKMGEEGRSPIIPVPNRWFLQPDKFPHQQKLVERVLATTGKAREDFPSGAFVDPRTGEVLDSRIMNELGVVIDPKTNRPMMTAKGESGIEVIDPRLGAFTKSNLVRKGLFKPQGGDQILNDLNFLATIEKGDVGHKYGLATEYASPAELWNTGTGANPTLRPRSRGDLFGVGDVVGQVRVGRSEPHDVYEKLFVAPKGSDVQGVKLSKAKGGEVKMQEGGAAFGVFPHMKRKRSKQDPEAAKRVPLDLARGFVAGTLGLPGDLESLARILMNIQGPDRFVMPTSKDEAMAMLGQIFGADRVSMDTKLPTSEEIEAKLPLRGDSPASSLATGIGQLAGGFYTGPASGARAMTAIPKAVVKAGKDFVMAAPQGAPRMFIGPKAKTWDQAKADRAAQMEKEGKDPVDIWRETGTFRSADGILRQEISDVGAIHRNPTQLKELGKQKKEEAQELQQRIAGTPGQKDMFPKALTEAKKPAREKVKTLKEEAEDLLYRNPEYRGHAAQFVLEHPELYKAYPELADVNILQGGRSGNANAAFSDLGGKGGMEIDLYESGLRSTPRSSLIHEMQHAIQSIEGMGPGGNPTFAFKNPKAFEILEELRKKALEPMSFEDYAKQYSHVPDLQQGYESYKRAIPRIVKNMENELQREAAMEYYKRLAGEAEARATQAREPMSASQRAQEFPYSSYDVLPEDLIVNPAKSFKDGGEVNMQDGGAAFGVFPQMKPRRSKQDPEAAKTFPIDVARGFVSGALGMPGDIESLVRMLPGFDEKTILPTSEDIEKRLPLRSDTPAARAATGMGQIGGGFYTGPLSGARAITAVPKAVMQAGRDFVQAAGQPAVNVVKPKGGNWLTGSVEKAVEPLKTRGLTQAQADEMAARPTPIMMAREGVLSKSDEALNQWIDRNLTNYIKKEMATPEDPVRKLAEQGIVHIPSEQVGTNRYKAPERRTIMGGEQLGQSEAARAWEDASDVGLRASRIRDLSGDYKEPWMENADLFTKIYSLGRETDALGFDHIIDVLKQDLAAGRIRPEQLNKVSMEQAVRRTYEFDQDMAKKMREAQIKATEGMPVVKEYPEGYKWVELTKPNAPENWTQPANLEAVQIKPNSWAIRDKDADKYISTGFDSPEKAVEHMKSIQGEKVLEDALKYEGETMGHCVGGYCPDVLAGRSRIYSLRDSKGEPHVTVEVEPAPKIGFREGEGPKTPEERFDQQTEWMKGVESGRIGSDVTFAAWWRQKHGIPEPENPPQISQIKGKQNAAPKEEYLPFVQDFVRSGKWSKVGDLKNTGLQKVEEGSTPGFQEWMRLKALGNEPKIPAGYYKPEELLQFGSESGLKEAHPSIYKKWRENLGLPPEEGMKAGGEVKMQAGGIAKLKALLGGGAKPAIEASAAERAAAGRMAADVIKATQPMKMSEAIGSQNLEGKGKLKVTQTDRTKVGGGNIGGAFFSALQNVDPFYADVNATWGVGKPGTAQALINRSDENTLWSTIIMGPDQLKTNPIVFNKLRRGFTDAVKEGKLSDELADKINQNLKPMFGDNADIRNPRIWQKADTFEKRALLADVMMGQGLPPNKGGVPLGGEKSGKGVIFRPTDILIKESEPMLLHPEYGGTVPTFAVGPRLFTLSDEYVHRPDLHPGFPYIIKGEDKGLVYTPAPGPIALRDYTNTIKNRYGANPGYFEYTMGKKDKKTGQTLFPEQDITDDWLTFLQKEGYAKGGKVSGLSAIKKV